MRHREEEGVALAARIVDLLEGAFPPVPMVHHDLGQQLGDLVDEVLVHGSRLRPEPSILTGTLRLAG